MKSEGRAAVPELIPVRMLNEHVYCPRLAYLEWAVEARYPGAWPEATDDDARRAPEQARGVYERVTKDPAEHGFQLAEPRESGSP